MPKTELTSALKRDLQLIELRNVLDPHRHYKKNTRKGKIPTFSQAGTVVEGPTEWYSGRINKKDRSKNFVEEEMRNEQATGRFKRKYNEIQSTKTSGKKGKEVAAGEVAIQELERRLTEAEANVKAKQQAGADKKSVASAKGAATRARKNLEAARIGQSGEKDMEQDADDRQQQGVPDEPIASRPSRLQRLPVSYAEQAEEVQADETAARILPDDKDPEYEEEEDLYAEALPEDKLPHAVRSGVIVDETLY